VIESEARHPLANPSAVAAIAFQLEAAARDQVVPDMVRAVVLGSVPVARPGASAMARDATSDSGQPRALRDLLDRAAVPVAGGKSMSA
jgi:hypothetical protein